MNANAPSRMGKRPDAASLKLAAAQHHSQAPKLAVEAEHSRCVDTVLRLLDFARQCGAWAYHSEMNARPR